jgi:hypothetical protein
VSIERKAFAHEEELVTKAILGRYPTARPEGITYWLDQWWKAKSPFIEAMGDIKIRIPVASSDSGEEEESGRREETDEELTKAAMLRKFTREFMLIGNERPVLSNWFLIKAEEPKLIAGFEKQTSWMDISGMGRRMIGTASDEDWNAVIAHPNSDTSVRRFILTKASSYVAPDVLEHLMNNVSELDNYRYIHFETFLEAIFRDTPMELLVQSKVASGMKLSKYLKILFPPEYMLFTAIEGEDYWKTFEVIWSRFIQEYKSNGTVVVSAAPIDYVMMSVTNSWSSCHSFKGGAYEIGGAAYAVDQSTLMAYGLGSKPVETLGVTFDNKTWRQVVHVDLANGAAVFGRHYPNNNAAMAAATRRAVNYMLADYHKVGRLWLKANGIGNVQSNNRFVYAETRGPKTRLKELGREPSTKYGVSEMKCLRCGIKLGSPGRWFCSTCIGDSNNKKNLYVSGDTSEPVEVIHNGGPPYPEADPEDSYMCACCGDGTDGRFVIWSPARDGFVCDTCFSDESFQCIYCGVRGDNNDAYLVGDEDICQECFDENYTYCDRCETAVHVDTIHYITDRDVHWCESCAEEYTACCECCSDTVSDYLTDDIGYVYCRECYSELYVDCDMCSCEVLRENAMIVNNEELCEDCVSEHYFECSNCGEMASKEEHTPVTDMLTGRVTDYCADCFKQRLKSAI